MEWGDMGTRRTTRPAGALLLAAMSAGGIASAADLSPLPEDFLEYLGSWESDDGDWLVANAAATPTAAQTPAPAVAAPGQPPKAKQSGVPTPAMTERKP
jgi:hypothetical protein